MKKYTDWLRKEENHPDALYHAKILSFETLLDLANQYQKDFMIDPIFENLASYIRYYSHIRYYSQNGMIMAMKVFGPYGK